MTERFVALASDVDLSFALAATLVTLVWLAFTVVAGWRARARRVLVIGTAVLSAAAVAGVALRPVVGTRESVRGGATEVLLLDASMRLELPEGERTRFARGLEALSAIESAHRGARLVARRFGERGEPTADVRAAPDRFASDLGAALRRVGEELGPVASVVVISDGRFAAPTAEVVSPAWLRELGVGSPVVHVVSVSDAAPADVSVRSVRILGSVLAHEPFAAEITVGCEGGLDCSALTVSAAELARGEPPRRLGEAVVDAGRGEATTTLQLALERAGERVLEVRVDAPSGDRIPENDRRFVNVSVVRDRIRLLHVAGQPTYDVRALRRWLKSDASFDLVTFFILRGRDDPTFAPESAHALIPFPVDELFDEHLASFDAVLLQDFDAVQYRLSYHLGALAEYVRRGGGLVLVGGTEAFSDGGYARSPLSRVLPVELPARGDDTVDTVPFRPTYTSVGSRAAMLRPLRDLLGERLPEMSGQNVLGRPVEGAVVLWEHPALRTAVGPMPVLAAREVGDGRVITLAVDGTWTLEFSALAAEVGGRAHAALWEGLVGWLMRDPRFELGRMTLEGPCVAGRGVRVHLDDGEPGAEVSLALSRLGADGERRVTATVSADGTVALPPLEAGGWALLRERSGVPVRLDFSCEHMGGTWADSRPDGERLARLAALGGGVRVPAERAGELPPPVETRVTLRSSSRPWAPGWLWASAAACALAAHWWARRSVGLR